MSLKKIIKHLSKIGLVICFLFSGLYAYSQNPTFNFQKLGSEDGLNNATIFHIEQHENGLVYFTTQNGIYYYDGYSFKKLEIDSLKSNALLCVSVKNTNELFLSIGDEGVANFNLKTKKFGFESALKLKENNADNIIITRDYAYLLTSEIKLLIVDLKTGKLLNDEIKKLNPTNVAYCIYKTNSGKIYVGRKDGLYEIINGHQIKLELLKEHAVNAITQNKQGKLVIGSAGKIYIINGAEIEKEITPVYSGKSSTFLPGGEKNIKNIVTDEFDRIWFTSYPHENLYLYQNNSLYNVFEVLDIPPSLINCVFKDESENIWIGTFNDGVYYLQNPFFNTYNFSYNGKALNVNQVLLKENLMVAATNNGLYGLHLLNNETKTLSKPDETFLEPVTSITPLNDVMYYTKRSQFDISPTLFQDSKNSYKFKPIIARQFYSINKQQSVVADWDLNVLLCNADATKIIDTLISFNDYRISVNAFLKHHDLLYVATNKGLFEYNFATKKNQKLIRSELNYNINHLVLINEKLYAAHEAGITDIGKRKLIQQVGKFRLNSVKKIKQFTEQIWLATLDGVFICDQNLEPLKIINKTNGLPSNSINDVTLQGDEVIIATARGVAATEYKNIIKYNTKLKPVTINRIKAGGQICESDENKYRFKPDEENISIEFYSPYFNKPGKQFFRWRVDGSEWQFITNLSFEANLTAGDHLIEISASIDNIVWSDNTAIKIFKEEKLSEKQSIYWLFTLCGLLFVILISFVWIRRVKIKAKKRLRDEQQVNLLKHQAMNSLLSPHFIFNSLTSIQNYINTNNSLKASEYLAKFSRLIRMIIEKSSHSEISLYDELARLTYYLELEKERFKNKFDYVINLDENIDTREVKIPNMIIQPHVENCIIHGILPKQEHGQLKLNFTRVSGKKLLITIEDDGVGLLKSKEHIKEGHKSLGTSTIKNILEINSKLSGKRQEVKMYDKSTLDSNEHGTIINIEIEL